MSEINPSFVERVRTGGFDVPSISKWFYVSFVTKPDGKFQGAAVVEGEHFGKAIDAIFQLNLKPKDAKCELTIEIPADKIPPEQYRSRLLTREEVEEIWPQVKEDKTK